MTNIFPKYIYKQAWKKIAAKSFDSICILLKKIFTFIPRHNSVEVKVSRILCIRLDHLGDVVMVQPALKKLRDKFPEADIHFMVSSDCYSIAKDLAELQLVLPVSGHWFSRRSTWLSPVKCFLDLLKLLRRHHYDMAIDFRGDVRHILLMFLAAIPERISYGITGGKHLLTICKEYAPEQHQIFMNMRLVGTSVDDNQPPELTPFQLDQTKLERFKKYISQEGVCFDKKTIIVHPGAGYSSKRWEGESYGKLCQGLVEKSTVQLILIGTQEEIGLMPVPALADAERGKSILDLRGKLMLEELPYLFRLSDFYIGNDSGPAHLAACENMKMIILFSGTNQPEFWHPWSKHLQIIRHPVSCSPCHAKVCLFSHHDCMNKITVKQVLEVVDDFFLKDYGRDKKNV